MSSPREIRYYDYVNAGYEQVRDVLRQDAGAVCRAATKRAASRAASLAAELHVNIGSFDLGTDINITVRDVTETPGNLHTHRTTTFKLEWEAAKLPRLFPFMHAELAVYPLTSTETQLELLSRYEPPLGVFGAAVDALVGHRIADASVHRFLTEVAAHLRQTLPT